MIKLYIEKKYYADEYNTLPGVKAEFKLGDEYCTWTSALEAFLHSLNYTGYAINVERVMERVLADD